MMTLDKTWFGGAVEKFFGSPAFKLVRREDPTTSYQAAQKVDTTKLESLVYEAINVSKLPIFLNNSTIQVSVRQGIY
jgi:hypothetical protein